MDTGAGYSNSFCKRRFASLICCGEGSYTSETNLEYFCCRCLLLSLSEF